MELAFYSQLPDELRSLTAWYWGDLPEVGANAYYSQYGLLPAPHFDEIQRSLHSLDGGSAKARRDCLRNLIADPKLKTWERGLLIHAFGDAYAHTSSGTDQLYEAPFGHAIQRNMPDYISQNPELFVEYMTDLTRMLNGEPLDQSQQRLLDSVLKTVRGFPSSLVGLNDALAMKAIAMGDRFGYPKNGYRPELHEPLSDSDFYSGPAFYVSPDYGIPRPWETSSLLQKIKAGCCKK